MRKHSLFNGLCHKLQLFYTRNFGELIDFQFKVFTVLESICQFGQPIRNSINNPQSLFEHIRITKFLEITSDKLRTFDGLEA